MMREDYLRLRAEVIARTAAAVRLRVGDAEDWIPLSHLGKASDRAAEAAAPGDSIIVYVPRWSADQRGWREPPRGEVDLFSAAQRGMDGHDA